MRMWGVHPRKLCRKHLLGLHVELHMIAGCVNKNKKLDKYLKTGLIDLKRVVCFHKKVEIEMKVRGYNHKTPLENLDISKYEYHGYIDYDKSKYDLIQRCLECAKNFKKEA